MKPSLYQQIDLERKHQHSQTLMTQELLSRIKNLKINQFRPTPIDSTISSTTLPYKNKDADCARDASCAIVPSTAAAQRALGIWEMGIWEIVQHILSFLVEEPQRASPKTDFNSVNNDRSSPNKLLRLRSVSQTWNNVICNSPHLRRTVLFNSTLCCCGCHTSINRLFELTQHRARVTYKLNRKFAQQWTNLISREVSKCQTHPVSSYFQKKTGVSMLSKRHEYGENLQIMHPPIKRLGIFLDVSWYVMDNIEGGITFGQLATFLTQILERQDRMDLMKVHDLSHARVYFQLDCKNPHIWFWRPPGSYNQMKASMGRRQ